MDKANKNAENVWNNIIKGLLHSGCNYKINKTLLEVVKPKIERKKA